jgi:hypothetical protein
MPYPNHVTKGKRIKFSLKFEKAKQPIKKRTDAFGALIMYHVGQWVFEKDWTMQLHLGPKRNPNTRLFEKLGPDSGFDTIGDWPQGEALLSFLDSLSKLNKLPKTIVYNLNPRDNACPSRRLRLFSGGSNPWENPIWLWMVVQRHPSGNGVSNQRALGSRPSLPLCWDAYRFKIFFILSKTRIFPPFAL